MKLFGNKRRRPAPQERRQQTEKQKELRQEKQPPEPVAEDGGRLSGRTKAMCLLAASICVFICAAIMCLSLIAKSAEPLILPSEPEAKELSYAVNSVAPSSVEVPVDIEAPVSRSDSNTLNILLLGRSGTQTDTFLLASVDLRTGDLALLSIPRDTYVAGSYEVPKISSVYAEADDGEGRGVKAVREMVKNMVGFEADYYFVLEEASLTAMLDLTGGMEFTVPESPDYSELSAGNQKMTGEKAVQLLCYREDYTDVETEPAAVQRDFLLTLLEALLKDAEAYAENAEKLAEAADTDLSAENLLYLAYLLQNVDTASVFSRALPGGETEIDDVAYYEVDPEAAIELLNAHFNPLKKNLTVYDVSFRQKTGDSGTGQYDPYGFGNTGGSEEETQDTSEESSEETTVPTEGPDPTDPTDPTDSTDPTDPTNPPETDPTESSTEPAPPPATDAPPVEP